MLIGIHPLLSGELLHALDEMGHGDALLVADANFPSRRLARGALVRVPVGVTEVVRAVLSVFPLDQEERPVLMASPQGEPAVQRELLAALPVADAARAERIARHDFYTAARDAALIVHTADVRPYANLMLRKAGINRLEA